ncbi:hypothetical protein CLF_107398 [Clonorchis sinensis]|uniref:Uncharacterized protein n=1 Tax=Clonorchis sinensis TaxID=79923 RepID=G7YGR1_CLOSI|nr:hypothetical protein CLF_107398 [Clonorchis sinensis]
MLYNWIQTSDIVEEQTTVPFRGAVQSEYDACATVFGFHSILKLTITRTDPIMPLDRSTRAETLPGCPSLDRSIRDAEVGFETRTFRSRRVRVTRRAAVSGRRKEWCNSDTFHKVMIGSVQPRRKHGAKIMPGSPSLDRNSRDVQTGFEPWTLLPTRKSKKLEEAKNDENMLLLLSMSEAIKDKTGGTMFNSLNYWTGVLRLSEQHPKAFCKLSAADGGILSTRSRHPDDFSVATVTATLQIGWGKRRCSLNPITSFHSDESCG